MSEFAITIDAGSYIEFEFEGAKGDFWDDLGYCRPDTEEETLLGPQGTLCVWQDLDKEEIEELKGLLDKAKVKYEVDWE